MFKKIILGLLACTLCFITFIGITNFYIKDSTSNQIYSNLDDADCILILGAGIRNNSDPSPMLKDRLEIGIQLYHEKKAPKIIMSGDHGNKNHDEVNIMKNYAIEKNVPSSDIFMDHAGFSTYESIYRAKEIFHVKKMIIVTQEYHLYRALYIANQFGIETSGIPSNLRFYSGQKKRDIREILARSKDFIYCLIKPKPKYLGDSLPVHGDGNQTNDIEI